MSEVADRYHRVADGFSARVAGAAAGAWAAPSPCTDWTARDVVVHVVRTTWGVRSLLGEAAGEVDPDGDLSAQWAEARGAVSSALADPLLAATVVHSGFGDQPFETLVSRLLCTDTLVHTWDLARASGQDERLDPAAVSAAIGFLAPIDEALRRPGGFGEKITPAPGADEQARLLGFCGRAV